VLSSFVVIAVLTDVFLLLCLIFLQMTKDAKRIVGEDVLQQSHAFAEMAHWRPIKASAAAVRKASSRKKVGAAKVLARSAVEPTPSFVSGEQITL
jgi:hypothetical protein